MADAVAAPNLNGWKNRAAQFYFLLILFSFPLFSIPCQKGSCSSPVEVAASSLLSNGADEAVVKALLYPGLIFAKIEAIVADNEPFGFPVWDNLLKDMNFTAKGHNKGEHSIPKFGFVVGSYLCIVGAFLSVLGTSWVSAGGMLTLLWYIYTLGGTGSDVFALPMFSIAMLCAVGGLFNLEGLLRRGPRAGEVSGSPAAHEEKKQK